MSSLLLAFGTGWSPLAEARAELGQLLLKLPRVQQSPSARREVISCLLLHDFVRLDHGVKRGSQGTVNWGILVVFCS